MKRIKKNIFAIIFFLLLANFNFANAQSKHASIWRVADYWMDFNNNPVTFSNIDVPFELSQKYNILWYANQFGKIELFYYRNKIYNKNFEEIDPSLTFGYGIFIVNPDDENLVFFIEQDHISGNNEINYYLIDVKNNKIKSLEKLSTDDLDLAVHHSDCSKIWLFDVQRDKITKFLLTNKGVEFVSDIVLKKEDYKVLPKTYNWEINFSKDCNYYSMTNFDSDGLSTEVYFGTFDRKTGDFSRVPSYDFSSNYNHINHSIIAPDNSKIFYFVRSKDGSIKIIEVPIVEEIPQFANYKELFSSTKKKIGYSYSRFMYGIDGNIYLLCPFWKEVERISFDASGKSVFTESLFNLSTIFNSRDNFFVSSYFMENPCENSLDIPLSVSVCKNSTMDYFIDNPIKDSKYVWNISPSAMGKIVSNTENYDKISVKWEKVGDAKIYVYEVNSLDCNSDASSIEVKILESPNAEFDNSTLCYGEPLNVILSGEAPFTLEYTLDNESFSIFDINSNIYKMPERSGKYSITKVIDKNCSTSPENNNNAVIGKQMNKLVIKIGE